MDTTVDHFTPLVLRVRGNYYSMFVKCNIYMVFCLFRNNYILRYTATFDYFSLLSLTN